MKYSTALAHLEHLLLACQKAKSNLDEVTSSQLSMPDSTLRKVKRHASPLTQNLDFPFMQALINLLDRVRDGSTFSPGEFYNMMFLIDSDIVVSGTLVWREFPALPKPNARWLIDGWDEE